MIRPTGSSPKAQYWQSVYDELMRRRAKHSLGFLTDQTTRGIFRRPVFNYEKRPSDDVPFEATWHFDNYNSRISVLRTVDVSGGFCFNSKIDERDLVAAGNAVGAIEADDFGLATNVNGGEFTGCNTIVQTKVFDPSVTRLRFQCESTQPFDSSLQQHLFIRAVELPFQSNQNPLERGWEVADLEYIEGLSHDGYFVFRYTAEMVLIFPTKETLAIVTPRGAFLKPRPDWGGVALMLKSTSNHSSGDIGTGTLILSNHSSAVKIYKSSFNQYRIPDEPSARYWWNQDAMFMPMVGTEAAYYGWFPSLKRSVFEISFNSVPNDGDTIAVNGVVRTWKSTVSNPALEIEIPAPGSGQLEISKVNFNQHVLKHPFNYMFFQKANGSLFVLIDTGTSIDVESTASSTGSWSIIVEKKMHNEVDWRPVPSGEWTYNPVKSPGTMNHTDWLAINVSENFDSEIELPVMTNQFFLQAFWVNPIRTDIPFETVARDITLTISKI